MDTHEHLYDMIKGFDTAMLVTCRGGDVLHARPMAVAKLEDGGDAYFATSADTSKIGEIEADPRVLMTFQGRSEFASVEGEAHVVRDRTLIERLWSPAWKTWFPGGKDDPSLCLLKVAPTAAEYWDTSGAQGLKYLFEGAKAVLQGRRPELGEDQHAKIQL